MLSVRQTQRLICRNVPEQLQQPNECSETAALILVSLRLITAFAFHQVLPSGTRDPWQRSHCKPESAAFGIVTENTPRKQWTETHTLKPTDRHTHTLKAWALTLYLWGRDDDRIIQSITFSHLESPFVYSLSDFLRTAVRCKSVCVLQESTSKYSGQTLWPPQHKGLNHTNRLIGGGMMEGGDGRSSST